MDRQIHEQQAQRSQCLRAALAITVKAHNAAAADIDGIKDDYTVAGIMALAALMTVLLMCILLYIGNKRKTQLDSEAVRETNKQEHDKLSSDESRLSDIHPGYRSKDEGCKHGDNIDEHDGNVENVRELFRKGTDSRDSKTEYEETCRA